MRKFLGLIGILGLVLGLGLKTEAADLYVLDSYTTIQSAINVATNGDWV